MSETRDGGVNQARVDLAQSVGTEAETVERAGAEVLDQNVHWLRQMRLPDPPCWGLRPAELLALLNIWLAPLWDLTNEFVAAQAFLRQSDGTVIGANAAIPDPLQRTAAPASIPWALPGGTMLGIMMPQTYPEGVLQLAPGEGLLAFTDGVAEAGSPQFGGALLDAFLTTDPLGPGLVSRLFAALQRHVPIGWPTDDTTACWLERPAAPDERNPALPYVLPVKNTPGEEPNP